MRTEEMRRSDAETAAGWMTRRIRKAGGDGKLVFPESWMPETGMVVLGDRDKPLAVAVVYFEKSSPVAVCGWCISDPDLRFSESRKAVRLVLSALPAYARRNGAEYLLTTFGNRGINRILTGLGFSDGDSGVQHKFMKL